MIRAIVLVGIGGGIGSALRFLTSIFVGRLFHSMVPYATFFVNILGCLLMGLLLGLLIPHHAMNQQLKYLFITGFCGGYTTFSAFASENYHLFQSGNIIMGMLYILSSVLFGIVAVGVGLYLSQVILK